VLKPVKYLGKITDENYEVLSEALSRGEEVEYEYDHPFFSPENLARLKQSISRLEAGKGIFREPIDAGDDDE